MQLTYVAQHLPSLVILVYAQCYLFQLSLLCRVAKPYLVTVSFVWKGIRCFRPTLYLSSSCTVCLFYLFVCLSVSTLHCWTHEQCIPTEQTRNDRNFLPTQAEKRVLIWPLFSLMGSPYPPSPPAGMLHRSTPPPSQKKKLYPKFAGGFTLGFFRLFFLAFITFFAAFPDVSQEFS